LEALHLDDLVVVGPTRNDERAGWPIVELIDRGQEDPRTRSSLVSGVLARQLTGDRRVVCVHNTKGVARLLACAACQTIARCEVCDAAVAQRDTTLVCGRCGAERPVVCLSCGASRMKALRPGVSRLRSELEAATGEPVVEVTAATAGTALSPARVYIGTEAVLHQVREADVVVFLDIDVELLAARMRADEQVMALLVRAARVVGGRAGGGRVLVQTSLPDHPVLQAALLADPSRLVDGERAARELLRLPPVTAIAAVSGAGAEELTDGLRAAVGVEVQGPNAGTWLVRARDHTVLCDALDAVGRPADRVRVEVDPLRV
jgi:primosomal protein N' (replication factor Y)